MDTDAGNSEPYRMSTIASCTSSSKQWRNNVVYIIYQHMMGILLTWKHSNTLRLIRISFEVTQFPIRLPHTGHNYSISRARKFSRLNGDGALIDGRH